MSDSSGGYLYDDLRVIGHAGTVGSHDEPLLLDPIFATPGRIVLEPPYEERWESMIHPSGSITYELFLDFVKGGHATVYGLAIQARPGHCLYAPEGDGWIEYVTYKEAHARMVVYADRKRAEGDALWQASDYVGALKAYELCASVSQDKDDYARILICDVDPIRERRLREWIRAQDGDPQILSFQIRKRLIAAAEEAR